MQVLVIFTVLILGAALLAIVLNRFGISSSLAYLLLGILVAPYHSEIFESQQQAESLAEIGVILLMFTAGLGIDATKVRTMLRMFVVGGFLQVALVTCAGLGTSILLGLDVPEAVIIGLMLACSSTAVLLKAYEESGELDSQKSRIAVAVSLFQDILVVIVLGFLPALRALVKGRAITMPDGTEHAADWLGVLGQTVLPLLLLPLLFAFSSWVLPRLFARLAALRHKEAFSLFSLGCCLAIALAARYAGGSTALGAFMGGLVLARTHFASQVLAELQVVRNLALGFFFIMIGMMVDFQYVWQHASALAACFVLFIAIKAVLDSLAVGLLKTPLALAVGVGIALAQISELSFALGAHAVQEGVLRAEVYQFVLTLAVLSMLTSPFLVNIANWVEKRLRKYSHSTGGSMPESQDCPNEQPRIIVIGYGPVGKMVAAKIRESGYRPVIVDLNMDTVAALHAEKLDAVYGDASHSSVLQRAGVELARGMFITIPDLRQRTAAIQAARFLNPAIDIFVRARFIGERESLTAAGATRIFFEEQEVALAMTASLSGDIPLNATESLLSTEGNAT